MNLGHIIFIVILILIGATFSNFIRGWLPILPEM